jgi:glycosyltransferase involved in cell wall biosynthesis
LGRRWRSKQCTRQEDAEYGLEVLYNRISVRYFSSRFSAMRVAIISDSPTLPTGFARTTRWLVKALVSGGHEVSCYGIGVFDEAFDRSLYRCRIWPAGDDFNRSKEAVVQFIRSDRPDVLLINYDLMATLQWLEALGKAGVKVPIISHLIVDGLPVYPILLESLKRCAAIITATEAVRVNVAAVTSSPVYHVPHLVDCAKFRPLDGAEAVRRALFPNSLVVGTIAQNRSRKQLVQTIHAIRLLRDEGRNPVFLLHTDRIRGLRFGGSPLGKIVEYFGLTDCVHITESHRRVDAMAEDAGGAASRFGRSLRINQLGELTVTERLNLLDVAVVASAFGGFEYGIIEAQACGVPVCVTDDGGIMMEVAGGACEPLRPALFEFTDYGAKIWKVAPETIATAIGRMADDRARREELQERGMRNVRRYDEALNGVELAETLERVLASLPVAVESRVA